jgi:serine/threonine-protein kinase
MHSLSKRAEDRYQTAAEFRTDVERAVAGSPVTAAVPMVVGDHTQQMPAVAAAGLDYRDDYRRPARKPRRAGFWIVSIIAIILAIVGAVVIGRFLLGGSSLSRVAVPNLDGLTIEQAASVLADAQLQLGAQTPELSDRPDGTVIAQQPAAGEQLEQNQSVNVTVSSGKEQATVPQLIALTSPESARIALTDAGLKLGIVSEKASDQPSGYVLEQSPSEGTQVDAGTMVNITVSSGLVRVPSVTGLSEAQARSDLAQAGFEAQVVEQNDSSVPEGTVLAQSPKADSDLARGSTVTITVAIAIPEPEPEPTIGPTDVPSGEPVVIP